MKSLPSHSYLNPHKQIKIPTLIGSSSHWISLLYGEYDIQQVYSFHFIIYIYEIPSPTSNDEDERRKMCTSFIFWRWTFIKFLYEHRDDEEIPNVGLENKQPNLFLMTLTMEIVTKNNFIHVRFISGVTVS
jgi:hypothetical protein